MKSTIIQRQFLHSYYTSLLNDKLDITDRSWEELFVSKTNPKCVQEGVQCHYWG